MTEYCKKSAVSVAMAVYNGEISLPEQLDSILSQSVPVREIVAVDDASTDASLKILQKYQRRYPDVVKIIPKSQNSGCTATFEEAIDSCSGEFIFLADQDDVWQADKVLKMLDAFHRDPVSEGVFSDSLIVDHNLKSLKRTHLQNRGFTVRQLQSAANRRAENSQLAQFLLRVPPAGHDMAFRSSMKKYLLPFPELPNCHDTWIGLVIAAVSSWAFVPESLTLFRQHGKNASGSGAANSGLAAQLRAARKSIADNTFLWYVELFDRLIDRIGADCTVNVLAGLVERKAHSQARADMNCPLKQRMPLILNEIRNGNYKRFGRGFKSVIQDIFLR